MGPQRAYITMATYTLILSNCHDKHKRQVRDIDILAIAVALYPTLAQPYSRRLAL